MSHDRFGYANYHRVTDQLVGGERTPVYSTCQESSGGSSHDSLHPRYARGRCSPDTRLHSERRVAATLEHA
jgi:hypothetical protein